jgi:bifunctional non-homologous end joining protein LigD
MSPKGREFPKSLLLHGVRITHADRIISKVGRITKGDVAQYYAAVAPLILACISRHPLSILRCPAGIDTKCFYQRGPGKGLGPSVHPFPFRHTGESHEYLYIEDVRGLMELVQMGAIEFHPWGSRIDRIDCPNWMIFDLDPAPSVPFDAVKRAAQELRRKLKSEGLESHLKCTGGKGLHVTVPLAAKDEWQKVKTFASEIAQQMIASSPAMYIATMSKAKREGKIFIDYLRNDYTATAIADYAIRAHPGAPVALPLEWKELESLNSADQFTMQDVIERIAQRRPSRPYQEQRIPSR